jgi:hypothetical protein
MATELVSVWELASVSAYTSASAWGLVLAYMLGSASNTDDHHKTSAPTRDLSAPQSASEKTPR